MVASTLVEPHAWLAGHEAVLGDPVFEVMKLTPLKTNVVVAAELEKHVFWPRAAAAINSAQTTSARMERDGLGAR